MSTKHVAVMLTLVLVARIAQAQQSTSEVRKDTLTILKGDSPSDVHVRLVSVGARVQVLDIPNWLAADTLDLTTPVRVVLPAHAFSLSVSSATDATVTLVTETSHGEHERFRSTIHAPVTLTRKATDGKLSVQATSGGRSERVP